MSDINLDFTVSNNSIDFTVQPNDITITPTDVQLTFSTSSQLNAGGSNTQLQYNNQNLLDGIPTATYNGSNLSLGSVANIKITGGVNGYVLQTDGTGNLDWAAAGGGGGNGTPGGSNTQIQYNDSGIFGGNAGFTFNEVSGNVNILSNLIVGGNISGNFSGNSLNSNFANFAGNAFNVSGANVTGTVANATYAVTAGSATTANTVIDNFQPNITSVGTLTNLSVSGNVTTSQLFATANITAPRLISNIATGTAPFIVTSSTLVANLRVANATFADQAIDSSNATRAINVTGNSQPNITSVGTLGSLNVTGTATAGTLSSTGNVNATYLNGIYASGTSNITIAPSGNITAAVSGSLSMTLTGNRLILPANLSVTGSATLGSISTGAITATGNVTGVNLITTGLLTATGNVTGGNIKTVNGLIETTNGNIYANNGYIIGGEGVFSGLRFVNSIAANVTVQAIGASVATNKIPISINGTTYYILLST